MSSPCMKVLGASGFYESRAGARYTFPTYTCGEIEARVTEFLTEPVPFLAAVQTPIPRPIPTQDAQRLVACRICGFTRRLIAYCWRCGYGGGPYHKPIPAEETDQFRAAHQACVPIAAGVPIGGVFAETLTWRDTREMVQDPRFDFMRHLVLRTEREAFLMETRALYEAEKLERESHFAELAGAHKGTGLSGAARFRG